MHMLNNFTTYVWDTLGCNYYKMLLFLSPKKQ